MLDDELARSDPRFERVLVFLSNGTFTMGGRPFLTFYTHHATCAFRLFQVIAERTEDRVSVISDLEKLGAYSRDLPVMLSLVQDGVLQPTVVFPLDWALRGWSPREGLTEEDVRQAAAVLEKCATNSSGGTWLADTLRTTIDD